MKRSLSLFALLIATVVALPLHAQELWIACEAGIGETTERIAGDVNCDVNDYTIVFERALRGEDVTDLFRARLRNEGTFDGFLKGSSASLAYMTAMVLLNTNRITVGDEIVNLLRNAELVASRTCNGFTGSDGAGNKNWRYGNTCFEDDVIGAEGYAWRAAFFRRIGDDGKAEEARSNAIRLIQQAFNTTDKQSLCIYDQDPDGDGLFETTDLDADSGPCNAGIDDLQQSLANNDGKVVVLALNHGHESPAYGVGITPILAHALVGLKAAGRPLEKSSDFGSLEGEIDALMRSLFEQGQRGSTDDGSFMSFRCYFGSGPTTPPFVDNDMDPINRDRPCQDRFAQAEWFMHTKEEYDKKEYHPSFNFYYRPAMYSVQNFYTLFGFSKGSNAGFQYDSDSFENVKNDFRSDRRAFFGPARRLIYHDVPGQWVRNLPRELCGNEVTFLSPPTLIPPDFASTVFVRDYLGSKYEWSITGGTITSGADKAIVNFRSGSSGEVRLTLKLTGLCGESETKTLTIPIGRGSLIFVDDTTASAGASTTFRARLFAVQGGPIPNQELIFKVVKEEIGRAVTDENGTAVLVAVISHLKPGFYDEELAVTWEGNDEILGSTWTADLTVVCNEYALRPPGYNLTGDGGTFPVIVTAAQECPWTPVADVPWITITVDPDRDATQQEPQTDGPGRFSITVGKWEGQPRSGHVTVGTKTMLVEQAGGCTFRLSPETTYVSSDPGAVQLDVITPTGCQWLVTTNASSWIEFDKNIGEGPQTIRAFPGVNPGPDRRTAKIFIEHRITSERGTGADINQEKPPPVEKPVLVKDLSGGGTVANAQNISMRIVVSGSPLHYEWYVEGHLEREGDGSRFAEWTFLPGDGPYPGVDQTWEYYVKVSNSKGEITSQTVRWTNRGRTGDCDVPFLTDGLFRTNQAPYDYESPFGNDVTLFAVGFWRHDPPRQPLTYQWYSGMSGDRTHKVGEESEKDSISVGLSGTQFYWVEVNDPDCGKQQSRTALVRRTTAPPPPCSRCRAVRHDFDGDNNSDIILHNSATGANEIWAMEGATRKSVVTTASNPSAAELQSIGDFNGDQRPDLVWRDPQTGANNVWIMSFTAFSRSLSLEPRAGGEWSIGAVADLDDDRNQDIVWHNRITGANEIWFLGEDGTTHAGTWALPSNPAGQWGLHGTGDFNRDGRPDLFFHDRATGANSVWLMNDEKRAAVTSNAAGARPGTGRLLKVTTHAIQSASDPNFVPMQIDDMDNDGWPDIVWRNVSTGDNSIWFMEGTSLTTTQSIASQPDLNWQIGGGGGSGSGGGGGSDSRTATTLSASADPAGFNGATVITATLTANGAPLGGRTLIFSISGTEAGRLLTDASGTAIAGASVAGIAAGTHSSAVSVRFDGDSQYAPSQETADLVIAQPEPLITWNTPAPISYGTPLGATQLNAAANVAGSFVYSPEAGAILNAGFNVLHAVFTPSDPSLATVARSVVIYVNPVQAAVSWPQPAAIAYGTPLSPAQLNGTANVSGSFTYDPPAGTILPVGTHALQATFTPDSANYTGTAVNTTIEIVQGTQTITWATPAPIVYGQALTSVQLNASVVTSGSTPAGALTYSPAAGTIFSAGTHTLTVTAAATQFYAAASKSVNLIVQKARPVITWSAPAPIVYGTALSAAQLNATANVPGTFTYAPAAGTVPNAGSQTLSGQFTPADPSNYESVSASVTLVVQKAQPLITWSAPAPIVYGTALSAAQLNATASVAGTFTYAPSAGTILNAGTHTLSVQFTPSDTNNYESASATTSITVAKAPQTLSWSAPAPIVYGTPLSATQLNATVSVAGPSPAGALTYDPPAGTILQAGNAQVLTVHAAETANYEPATRSVTIDVLKQKPVLSWAQPAPIVYRTPLGASQLNATSNIAGTFAYTPPAGTVLEAGPQSLSAHFTPSDTRNYEEGDISISLEVEQATPVITWSKPAGIVYGTALSATQLNATADVPGTVTYDPAAGTILDAGNGQTLSVQFTPNDTRNFTDASASVTIDVAKAKQTLSWSAPAAIVYGTPLSATQLNAQVSVVGPAPAGALVYTPTAGTVLDAGTHTLRVDALETPNYEPATLSVSILVHRAPLSLTVDAKSKLYGAPLPVLTGTLTGVQNNDPITPSYATTATHQSGTGTYPITGTLVDPNHRLPNYDVTITNATLTIHPAPLTLAANPATKQYSDPLPQLTATFNGFVLGETPAVLAGSLVIETTATALSAPGTYPIAIGGLTSSNYAITYIGSTFTVTAEDARVTITSPLFVSTQPTMPSRVTLSATVKDISATEDADGDAAPGDIRNATLVFVDRATNDVLCTAPIGLVAAEDLRSGVATCTFTRNFPAGASSLTVGARVGSYYTRDAAADDVTLTLAAPTADSITGGGATSSGAFNLNLQYDKKGLKGNVTFIFDHYEITATALDSLAIRRTTKGGTAYVIGTAVLRDATTSAVIDEAVPLIVTATDDGEPSTRDTLSVVLLKKDGGHWLATGWDGTRAVAQPLVRGNIAVHQAK